MLGKCNPFVFILSHHHVNLSTNDGHNPPTVYISNSKQRGHKAIFLSSDRLGILRLGLFKLLCNKGFDANDFGEGTRKHFSSPRKPQDRGENKHKRQDDDRVIHILWCDGLIRRKHEKDGEERSPTDGHKVDKRAPPTEIEGSLFDFEVPPAVDEVEEDGEAVREIDSHGGEGDEGVEGGCVADEDEGEDGLEDGGEEDGVDGDVEAGGDAGKEFGEGETVVTGKSPGCAGAGCEEIGCCDGRDDGDDAIQGDSAGVASRHVDEELSDWAAGGGSE